MIYGIGFVSVVCLIGLYFALCIAFDPEYEKDSGVWFWVYLFAVIPLWWLILLIYKWRDRNEPGS